MENLPGRVTDIANFNYNTPDSHTAVSRDMVWYIDSVFGTLEGPVVLLESSATRYRHACWSFSVLSVLDHYTIANKESQKEILKKNWGVSIRIQCVSSCHSLMGEMTSTTWSWSYNQKSYPNIPRF